MEDQTLHHFMQDLAPIVIGVVLIIAAAWVIIDVVRAVKDKSILQTKAELYNRLLDKFNSAEEFVNYSESEAGRQFVEDITVRGAAPTNKILDSIQRGIVMVLAGCGAVILGNIFDNTLGGDLYIVLIIGGTTVLMLGVGFLISTVITYRLSKSWGLIGSDSKPKVKEPAVDKDSTE